MNINAFQFVRSQRPWPRFSAGYRETVPSSRSSILPLTVPAFPLFCLLALLVAGNLFAAEPAKPLPALPPAPAGQPASGESSKPLENTNAAVSTTTNGMDTLDDKHRLAIGDRLSFRIIEDEEDPKQLFVTDSGDLEVPYLGRFPAEGRSCKGLAWSLKLALEKEHYYQATVILAVDVMAKSRGKVYIVGPVRGAGPQEIPSDEVLTLSKAILRAGGFGDFADKTRVKVTRKKAGSTGVDQTFVVNVAMILEKGQTALDLPLEPGDFIYVPERSIRF